MRALKAAVLIVLALAVPLGAVAFGYEAFAYAASYEIRRSNLPRHTHNAIKHAYASAEFYASLRPVLGPEWASAAVVHLGEFNERIERHVKHDPDWSREAYKDMRNNLTGIEAAEWLHGQAGGWTWPTTRLRLIGELARLDVLVPQDRDARLAAIPDERAGGPLAIRLMRADHDALKAQIDALIAEQAEPLRRRLGL
ncbi:hypothetical protein [Terrihabitans sp. B22-R8]|uniref:hypothetical protein n=1 Tax=Terrihabitans sp. B22-R8 TaxID=3425128 RepID=UPI00403C49A2